MSRETKLRLLITPDCFRLCEWCNNQYWDLDSLPVETDFKPYSLIMLTGGEPLLYPGLVKRAIKDIRDQTAAPIYLYTAKLNDPQAIVEILYLIDGMSVTPHDQRDVEDFLVLNRMLLSLPNLPKKSLKLNLFDEGFQFGKVDLSLWIVKNKTWIKEKHLPKGEVFKRYNDWRKA